MDTDLYRQHVVHYFDNQMGKDILNLSAEDKHLFFSMMQQYAGVLQKIFHPGVPLIEHILGNSWNASEGNLDAANEMIAQYEAWKNSVS